MRTLLAIMAIGLLSSFMLKQKKQRIVFFGDSITQAGAQKGGYIQRIDSMLAVQGKKNEFELIGAGIGGNKIYDLYLRMDEDVLAKNPDVVVVWVGVNDVWHKRTSGTGTDPDKFIRFYQALVNKLKEKHIKVILCTPAAIGEKTDHTNELDGDLNKYAGFIRGLADKNDCPLIDLRKAFLEYNLRHNKDNRESGVLTTDRVHLNPIGNQFVAEQMMKILF